MNVFFEEDGGFKVGHVMSDIGTSLQIESISGKRSKKQAPQYDDVVAEVKVFLAERIEACVAAGIPREQVIIDPGFGFGKALGHNLRLFKYLDIFQEIGLPMLVGVSRKSMIGAVLGHPVEQRLPASIALAALAVWQGAMIIRAHDVRVTVDAVNMIWAVKQQN